MIFGVGVDMLEVSRIGDVILKYGERFLLRIFSDSEIAHGNSVGCYENQCRYFAKRFAAKEACIKSIGGRFGFGMKNIEVLNNSLGRPELVVNGNCTFNGLSFFLSLSDERCYAIAVVVACRASS